MLRYIHFFLSLFRCNFFCTEFTNVIFVTVEKFEKSSKNQKYKRRFALKFLCNLKVLFHFIVKIKFSYRFLLAKCDFVVGFDLDRTEHKILDLEKTS